MFLSILDDFRGVLFLTTNRVGLIDEALKSRIHIALAFPRLDAGATQKVWKNQIVQGRENYRPTALEYSDRDVMRFVRQQRYRSDDKDSSSWNARQIQNAFHASVVLAAERSRTSSGNNASPSSTEEQATRDENPSGIIQLRHNHLRTVSKLRDAFESYRELRLDDPPLPAHVYINT